MIRSSRGRTLLAALAVATGLALSGCTAAGGPGVATLDDADRPKASNGASDAPVEADAVKFAACLREQGLDVPDPASKDDFSISIGGEVDEQTVNAAMDACEQFTGGGSSGASDAEQLAWAREFSACMRENGVADFPDPAADGSIRIEGDGFDPNSPAMAAAERACNTAQTGSAE